MIRRIVVWLVELDEQRRRWLCRRFGHKPAHCRRGEPVASFPVCRRCGKFGRAVVHGEFVS